MAGEQALSAWMADNAFVSWVVRERPWELEDDLIAAVDLPLTWKAQPQPVPPGSDPDPSPVRRAGHALPNPGRGGR
jgi:hypothetical protein